jgi:uroporphyrin-III C-methyltransferase/precorrin-2 dehydrogenase/sirohydrochlorin ferrochelatase
MNLSSIWKRGKPRRGTGGGEVFLVGAGPGDPELLTLRALRVLQQADVVLYDHLVSPAIVALAPRGAELIYVGKERNRHTLRQEAINELLARLAREGKCVVRLKGGDPFVVGRGGEEIETLAEQGIAFQVVPGHLKDGSTDLDWTALARPRQTVVIYMGLVGLPVVCRELIAHGLPSDTPAAIVQQGTTPDQRVVTGTLDTLPGLADAHKLVPPTLIIVGEVVRLQEKLAWFDPVREDEATDGEAAANG